MPTATKRERQRINREARRQAILEAEKRRKRNKTVRNVALLLVPVLVIFMLVRSGGDDSGDSAIKRNYAEPPLQTINPANGYTATFTTSKGVFTVELDAANAPIGVNNFVFLARNQFYDGLKVVRVAKDFVFQAGSPSDTTNGTAGYIVQAEVPKVVEGVKTYPFGTVAMAKQPTEPAGTAGSQFFVVTNPDGVDLPPDYAIIGAVTGGNKTVKAIGKLAPGSEDGPPTQTVTLEQVKVKTTPTSNPIGG